MRLLKKICAVSYLLAGGLGCFLSSSDFAFAVSDEVICIHEKQGELVEATTLYYLKDYRQSLPEFMQNLDEEQTKIMVDAFTDYAFPKFIYSFSGLSLEVEVRSIDLLCAAVKAKNLNLVKLIVENLYIEDINDTGCCGSGSPLCIAYYNDCGEDMIDYLLSVGANPYIEYGKAYIPQLFEKFEQSRSE